jgi:S-adenosylmethionine-diacylglycerol 3-amino-3-carboxypropyl transferase
VGIDRYNLSDVFEYMSAERTAEHLQGLVAAGRTGGRLVYWNTLVPRSRADELADRLAPLDNLAAALYQEDKAFFYSRLVVEEIR